MKKKLTLEIIQVESFITKLDQNAKITLNGQANSGYKVCSLLLSGCVLSFTCPVEPPVKDDAPAKFVTQLVNGRICDRMIRDSNAFKELTEPCPYEIIYTTA